MDHGLREHAEARHRKSSIKRSLCAHY